MYLTVCTVSYHHVAAATSLYTELCSLAFSQLFIASTKEAIRLFQGRRFVGVLGLVHCSNWVGAQACNILGLLSTTTQNTNMQFMKTEPLNVGLDEEFWTPSTQSRSTPLICSGLFHGMFVYYISHESRMMQNV